MIDKGSPLVREGWTGPGRCDIKITPRKPEEDGLHIDMFKKGMYEQNRTFRKLRSVVLKSTRPDFLGNYFKLTSYYAIMMAQPSKIFCQYKHLTNLFESCKRLTTS